MRGEALTWFQAIQDSEGLSTWIDFLQAIQVRFSAPKTVEDLENVKTGEAEQSDDETDPIAIPQQHVSASLMEKKSSDRVALYVE